MAFHHAMTGFVGASPVSVVDEKRRVRGASQGPRVRLRHAAALDDASHLPCENPVATSKLRSHNTRITAKTERLCT
jgi:hypothetical protein